MEGKLAELVVTENKTPEQLVLENRKIKVVPINRGRAFFAKEHDGGFMFTGCWRHYGLPINASTRSYFNPFKAGEQAAFERLFNLPAGAMNISDMESKFWGKYKIRLDKEGMELNLAEPDHALAYRIMGVNPKFAKQGDDINRLEYQYQLVDERYAEEEVSKQSLKKMEAYAELNKLSKNRKQMVDTLRLLGVKMGVDTNIDALKSKLAQIIEEPATNKFRGLKTIDDFMKICKDPQASIRLFVLDALDNREVIIENGDEYRLSENNKLIGRSLQGAVDWFADVANQETKLLIQERIKIK
jgi:hypothetical protein